MTMVPASAEHYPELAREMEQRLYGWWECEAEEAANQLPQLVADLHVHGVNCRYLLLLLHHLRPRAAGARGA